MSNVELEVGNIYRNMQNKKNKYLLYSNKRFKDITGVGLLHGCFINISISRKEQGWVCFMVASYGDNIE